MKNMILGMAGCIMLVYGLVIALTCSVISLRKNEMDNSVSAAMAGIMQEYYLPEILREHTARGYGEDFSAVNEQALQQLTEEISTRLGEDHHVETDVRICDMEKGIISIEVTEEFELPTGTEKTIRCCRTILADRRRESDPDE